MRITNRMLGQRAFSALSKQAEAVAHAQDQVVSGRRIVKPSDDPAATRQAIRVRDTLDQTNQYLRNIDIATARMAAAEAAFSTSSEAMLRARELALQGANGSLSAADRASIAREVDQLARTIVGQAAARNGSEYVFSGFRTDVAPFTEAPAGSTAVSAYAGDGGAMLARIGPGVTVVTNSTADVAFRPALQALATLHGQLVAGSAVSGATLAALDAGSTAIADARTDLGARQNRMELAQRSLGDVALASTRLLSELEDVDLAKAITDLTTRQAAYEAAVKTNARILQTSLLDYLR